MKFRRKKEVDYYTMLSTMIDCTLRAAVALHNLITDYDDVENKAEKIHEIEHEGDNLLHKLTHALNKAFITPLDREDLMLLGDRIDNLTDSIEDVALTMDMLLIKEIREDIIPVSELMLKACTKLVNAFVEFRSFKTSKTFTTMIIEVNNYEEAADRLHRKAVKCLFQENNLDTLEVLRWKEIYDKMELVLDSCEDVADALELIAVKNR